MWVPAGGAQQVGPRPTTGLRKIRSSERRSINALWQGRSNDGGGLDPMVSDVHAPQRRGMCGSGGRKVSPTCHPTQAVGCLCKTYRLVSSTKLGSGGSELYSRRPLQKSLGEGQAAVLIGFKCCGHFRNNAGNRGRAEKVRAAHNMETYQDICLPSS